MLVINLKDFYEQDVLDNINNEEEFQSITLPFISCVPTQFYLIKTDGNIITGRYYWRNGLLVKR